MNTSSPTPHPVADRHAAELGLGPLDRVHRQGVDLTMLVAGPAGLALIFGMITLFSGDGSWWKDMVAGALVGAVLGALASAVLAVFQYRATKRGLEVRYYAHGLVMTDRDHVVAGQWHQLQLSRSEMPRRTYHWSVVSPAGRIEVSDTAWSDIGDVLQPALERRAEQWRDAQGVLARGEAWDFSGWELTRWGVRTPRVAGRWGELTPKITSDLTSRGWRRRVVLIGPHGQRVDEMDLEDNDLLATILEPFVRVEGR